MTPWHDRRRFTGFLDDPGAELQALVRLVNLPKPAPDEREIEEALIAELHALRVPRPDRIRLLYLHVGRYRELLDRLRLRGRPGSPI